MRISKNYAIAMVNADFSGLSDSEVKALMSFPDFTVIDWSDDTNDINGKCRISGLWDNTVEIELK